MATARSREPDAILELDMHSPEKDIIPIELNSDGRDDLLLFKERNDTQIQGILLLSEAD